MKSAAAKLKEEDKSYTEKPSSSTAHGSHPLKQTQKSHAIRLLKACQSTSIQGISLRVPEGKGVTKGAEGGRPLAKIKTKFLAMITCICGKDVINGDELPRATPVEGDPNISDPWNYQHNVHLDPIDYGIPLNWANHIDIQSYLSEAQLDYTETTISDYMLFKQEPPIVALKRLRSWGIRPHLDETHLRHLEQVMQAGTTAHRRRLEPSSTTATAPSPQSLKEEVNEEEPPAYSC
ncbi:hypothetical protein PC9H_003007 [Pleurotus ostreatus]|uniref:Uncharacterized protein n=1 Tax=Pleurotus ostreatus TaxID=5322 RepID=A0A8H7A1J0_PLEOS|nr:uncharacterized protein PC9H_003007 [Pleurotus ostreatus]KAF7436181.1 hypothetical protein PC9H_003007 [Pleurotus ostreatus]